MLQKSIQQINDVVKKCTYLKLIANLALAGIHLQFVPFCVIGLMAQ